MGYMYIWYVWTIKQSGLKCSKHFKCRVLSTEYTYLFLFDRFVYKRLSTITDIMLRVDDNFMLGLEVSNNLISL